MRHHDRNRKLGRVKRQRRALLKSLARALLEKERMVTTVAKAKSVRPFVERLITASKRNSLASRRFIHAAIGGDLATGKKMDELRVRFLKRPGGYTRIIRLGRIGKRVGEMVRLELLQYDK